MNICTDELQADLVAAIDFFTNDEFAKHLPFIHSFPKNCCEVASALLVHTLCDKYGEADVVRVRGTNPKNNEAHFWVEADGLVLDPTAHQFAGFTAPYICAAPNPLAVKYSIIERELAEVAIAALYSLGITSEELSHVLNRLAAWLKAVSRTS